MELSLWGLISLIAYVVGVVVLFIGFTINFFRRHPDGAPELDELPFINYFGLLFLVVLGWPLVLIGYLVGKYYSKAR